MSNPHHYRSQIVFVVLLPPPPGRPWLTGSLYRGKSRRHFSAAAAASMRRFELHRALIRWRRCSPRARPAERGDSVTGDVLASMAGRKRRDPCCQASMFSSRILHSGRAAPRSRLSRAQTVSLSYQFPGAELEAELKGGKEYV